MLNFLSFKKIFLIGIALGVAILIIWAAISVKQPIPSQGFKITPRTAERIKVLRGQLSEEGKLLREDTLQAIHREPAALGETTSYRISYLPSPDIFYVEIKSVEIEEIKQEAVGWFLEQGFSKQDICGLPVVFYVGGEAFDYFKQVGGEFDPFPPDCVVQ